MKLEDLYNNIKLNNVNNDLIIFVNQKDNDFISKQYIDEISKQHNLQKEYIEDLSEVKTIANSFSNLLTPTLKIYKVDKFDYSDPSLLNYENVIISCTNISKEVERVFANNIVSIPKLEEWQIKDFIYSQLPELDLELVNWLYKICDGNLYRISLEIDRLKIFPTNKRVEVINEFIRDYIYGDLTVFDGFALSNAIMTRNKKELAAVYNELLNLNYTPMGLVALLYNNIKKTILVKQNLTLNWEDFGMTSKQVDVIRRRSGAYSIEELEQMFMLVTNIDKKLKTGDLDSDLILDYILINIFGV